MGTMRRRLVNSLMSSRINSTSALAAVLKRRRGHQHIDLCGGFAVHDAHPLRPPGDALPAASLPHRIPDSAITARRRCAASPRRFRGVNAVHRLAAAPLQNQRRLLAQQLARSQVVIADPHIVIHDEDRRRNRIQHRPQKPGLFVKRHNALSGRSVPVRELAPVFARTAVAVPDHGPFAQSHFAGQRLAGGPARAGRIHHSEIAAVQPQHRHIRF